MAERTHGYYLVRSSSVCPLASAGNHEVGTRKVADHRYLIPPGRAGSGGRGCLSASGRPGKVNCHSRPLPVALIGVSPSRLSVAESGKAAGVTTATFSPGRA